MDPVSSELLAPERVVEKTFGASVLDEVDVLIFSTLLLIDECSEVRKGGGFGCTSVVDMVISSMLPLVDEWSELRRGGGGLGRASVATLR